MKTLFSVAPSRHYPASSLIGAVLGLLIWLAPAVVAAQAATITGQVLDAATQAPVPYASVGVLHRPAGTVADDQGRFTVDVPGAYDQDSLRVGLLGYAPLTVPVAAFRQQLARSGGRLLLRSAPTELAEVVVRPGTATRRVIGNSTVSNVVSGGFKLNKLGNQLAQGLHLRRPAALEQVSFHVAECTYDSLFYRVNVYQVANGVPTASLLPEPVYVRVRKGQTKARFVADLRRFNLVVQGDIAVGLEMVKELGPGELRLSMSVLKGPIYIADQSAGDWEKMRGFGLGIDATVVEYR
jgi:hypothetical protein